LPRITPPASALEVACADRVDLVVVALDAADRVLRQLDRRHLLRFQRSRQFDGGLETPLRSGQGMPPFHCI
jgi:translation initiation factor IF-3